MGDSFSPPGYIGEKFKKVPLFFVQFIFSPTFTLQLVANLGH